MLGRLVIPVQDHHCPQFVGNIIHCGATFFGHIWSDRFVQLFYPEINEII